MSITPRLPILGALVLAGVTLGLATDATPRVLTRKPARPTHGLFALGAASSSCPKAAAKQVASQWKSCPKDEKTGKAYACEKYDPPLSDRCAAETHRSAGVVVDYTYFGHTDCNTWTRKRKVERIAIHNGGKASQHVAAWQCRKSGAHYTIERDGRIYQHVGEERASPHASDNDENNRSIGIELQTQARYGGRCNAPFGDDDDGTKSYKEIAKARGLAVEDVVAELCGPSVAQYESLRALIADIESRHPIEDDGVFGHCEVEATDHGDPRAVDWRELGMAMRPVVHECDWNKIAAVKSKSPGFLPRDDGGAVVIIPKGSRSGIEVGDHAYLADGSDKVTHWFSIDVVNEASARGWVPGSSIDLLGKRLGVTVVSTPGRKPTAVLSAAATGRTTSAGGTKAALGSCATDYTYWKKGTIANWTTRTDGTIDTVEIANAGSDHRICDDSTGLVYVGDVDGDYLTDGSGTKVKLTATRVDATKMRASVAPASIRPDRLVKGSKVVLRAKPK